MTMMMMENSRGVRRVFSRFSRRQPTTNTNCNPSPSVAVPGSSNGGRGCCGEKLKGTKQVLRRSNVSVGAGMGSDGEDRTMKRNRRVELPSKVFGEDRNPVDHSSVPRKLRSAMTKGICKSLSPPLLNQKRLHSSSIGLDSIKRSKLGMQNRISEGSTSGGISGPISREEEEVAGILYALAGRVPDDGSSLKNNLDGGFSMEKTLHLSEDQDVSTTASEVLRRDSGVTGLPTSSKVTNNSLAVELSSAENDSPANPAWWPKLSEVTPFKMNEKFSIPGNLIKSDMVVHATDGELCLDTSLRRWNCLPSRDLGVSGVDGHAISSSAADFPARLRTAVPSTEPESHEFLNAVVQVSPYLSSKVRSRKRCTTHAYIAHLIQEFKFPELNGPRYFEDTQQCSSDDFSPGLGMKSNPEDFTGKGLDRILFPCNIAVSIEPKNHEETGSSLLMSKSLHPAIKQALTVPEPLANKNQGFDFLSLSSGSSGPVAKAEDIPGDGSKLPSQASVPYRHLLPRCSPVVSFALPGNHHPSNSYRNQDSTAAAPSLPQLHLKPDYSRGQIRPLHIGVATSATQLQLQQPQQQQQIWPARQAAAQHWPGPFTAGKIVDWQEAGHGQHPSLQFMQTFLSPSIFNGQARANCFLISPQEQQQQLTAVASTRSSPIKSKTAYSQLSSGYEEKGSQLSLQLLCNDGL